MLKDQLNQDMRLAMKQRDRVRTSIIRLVKAGIKNKEIELGEELDDNRVIKVILALVKQHKESIEQFQKGGRDDLVRKEQAELEILECYLPEQMSEEEVMSLVREAVVRSGAISMKDVGKVMKYIMPKIQGRADGKMINERVKQSLGQF